MKLNVFSLVITDLQHEFIRDARSHERKIRIELKDFIDRMKKKKGLCECSVVVLEMVGFLLRFVKGGNKFGISGVQTPSCYCLPVNEGSEMASRRMETKRGTA